ncbi:MAG: rod shape-determining protein MreD [Myxococcales bacterium]|nr:rod shape-determining protein MreD [Myxococcales bacterium]
MRLAAQIVVAYLVLLVLSAVWRLFPWSELVPDIAVLFAAYLGLTAREKAAPSVASAVFIGYLADLLFGTPAGLIAFCSGLTCSACHLIQGRLLVRGSIFTTVFSCLVALATGVLTILIRSLAGLLPPGWSGELGTLVLSALITGLLGPLVFRTCRFVDSRFARTRRERDAAASGMIG